MPDFASLLQAASEFGPLAGLVFFLTWYNARQGSKLLDALLVELRDVKTASSTTAAAQAAQLAELKGIRQDLARAERDVRTVAERSTEHGRTLTAHGAKLDEHARRLDQLEAVRAPLRRLSGVPRSDARSDSAE